MAKKFQAPAILTRIAYTKDRGLSLGFATQELSDEEKVAAAQFHQQFGYLLFKPNEFKEEDVPKEDALTEGKSQSQRLRDVLYVLWAQKADPKIDYNTYYRQETEKIIAHYKSKID